MDAIFVDKEEWINIIFKKIKSAQNHLERLNSDNSYQRDLIMIAKLRGEIDAYNDIIALIRGMKDDTQN